MTGQPDRAFAPIANVGDRGGEFFLTDAWRAGLEIHHVHTPLFAPATLLIAAPHALALGWRLYGPAVGTRLAVGAGLAGAVAFLAVDLLMDALGLCAAALAAGAAIGALLPRRPEARP